MVHVASVTRLSVAGGVFTSKVSGFTAEVIAPGHLRAEAVNYKNVLVKKKRKVRL